jgi:hypothetical protein
VPSSPGRARRAPRALGVWVGIRGLPLAGCCATSRSAPETTIDEAALAASCLAAPEATARLTPRKRYGPWPKERLVEGGLAASLSLGRVVGSVVGVRLAARPRSASQ